MIGALTVLSYVVVARELVILLFRGRELGRWERLCYVALVATVLWLGTVWSLAIVGALTRPALLVRTVLLGVLALVAMWRARRRSSAEAPMPRFELLVAAVPIVLWVTFVLIRAAIVPPLSHDALAYHLPKAVLYARAHGYAPLPFLNEAIRGIPANYEMLLADILLVEQSDALTEWPSAFFYVAAIIAALALAERWWGRSPRALAAMALFAAGAPVALLHAGAHKNDLLLAFLTVSGLVAAGRFLATSELSALCLTAAAFAAAVGTKPQAGVVALSILPFILYRAARALRVRDLALAAGVACIAFVLLGGFVYLRNLTGIDAPSSAAEASIGVRLPYGDYANLWQIPYTLVAAPFSLDPLSLHVPWEDERWFWRRYEIYFSHLGIPFAICFALLPIGLVLHRRRAAAEALPVTLAAVAGMAVMLPTYFHPHGMFAISAPRYVLFLVPIVAAWTIVPYVAAGERTQRAVAIVVALAAFFAYYAVDFARRDSFQPFRYVVWAAQRPGTRAVPFDPNRAASVVDRAAGPRDAIALDAAFGSWIHPAFGRDLQRPVLFVTRDARGVRIPRGAQWVIVDRGFQSVWMNPQFTDLSQARKYLLRGEPSADDTRLIELLRRDERFELVFYNRRLNQAVFKRRR